MPPHIKAHNASIVTYYALKVQKKDGKKLKEVQLHPFAKIDPNDYRPVFLDKGIRDDFNEGLALNA